MARVTGSHLICAALKLEGVKNIFGLAGDHILPVLDVMADEDFRIIDTRHEQAAVHMADAWSRLTEQPGVCMYTTPGFANAIPGLTNAMHTEGPVISIAGCAAGYTLSGDALQRFVETTRVPVVTEEQARGLIPDDHPYAFGFFERGLNRAAAKVRDADVVVLLGRKQDFVIGFCRPPHVSADAKIIQIDPSPLEIGRNRGVAVGMVGDVTSVLDQLTKEASNHVWKELPWIEELRAVRAAQAEWTEKLAQPKIPMHALFVHKTVQSILRPDDCLVFDGGDFCHFGRSLLPALKPKHWLYVSSLGMLGSSLPQALAAKVAYPDSRVIMLSGDGAFGFNAMEFDTAVRHKLNVVAILGNDSAWGIDRQIQLGLYGRSVATDLLQTRYEQVVKGLGGYGEFVERPEDLAPALQRALAFGKPALLNVAVERAISPRGEAAIGRRKATAGK